MAFSVQMPALGESVTEGTVTRWLKHEGDPVEVDEPLLEVSTDKVDTEIPSPAAGVLQRIVVAEDETVEVGAELAVIGEGNGGASAPAAAAPAEQASQAAAQPPAAEPPAPEQPAPEQPSAAAPPAAAPAAAPPAAPPPPEPRSDAAPARSDADATTVTMPALGESVTEGTVTRWLKQVGDEIAVDEPLLEVSTDKVDTEIPSPAAGVLLEISVGEDEVVAVGGRLAMIGAASAGGAPDPAAGGAEPAAAAAPTAEPAAAAAPTAEPAAAPEEAPPAAPEQATPADAANAPAEAAPAEQAASADQEPRAPLYGSPWRDPGPEPASTSGDQSAEDRNSAPAASAEHAEHPSDGTGVPYVTPLVRKLAAEQGVDLRTVTGTGVGGRIRKQDVVAAAERAAQQAATIQPAEAATSAPAAASSDVASTGSSAGSPAQAPTQTAAALRGTTEKMSRLRSVIATRMVESLQVSAQLTSVVEVDVTRIAQLRNEAKRSFEAREGVKLSFLPFFAKATVEALKQFPKLNASIDVERKEITYHPAEHLGVAVDTDRGLLVPVIHDAGDLNIAGLARKISELAERTRTNKISPDELGGGTFTLTNTGSRGALFDTPIINQPQVGILGTGAVVKRPVVVSGSDGDVIAIRSMVYLALSYDHRLVDGADAARFLTAIRQRLEDGSFQADLGL